LRGHGFIVPYDKVKTRTIPIHQNKAAAMKMNGHPVRFKPRKKPQPTKDCMFCIWGNLHFTVDRTSIVCDGCGTIMPAGGV
jgi:hypothetical protein